MKRSFCQFAAGLALCGALLAFTAPVAARNGKSAFGGSFGPSGGASMRSNLSASPRMLSSSPNLSSSMMSKSVGTFNNNIGVRSLQKAPASSFLTNTNKFSQGGTSFRNLGSTNSRLTNRNLNSALLNKSKLSDGLTTRRNFNNFNNGFNKGLTNNTRLADALKNGGLKPITGGNTARKFGDLPNRSNLLDRGKIADAIKNGGLKPIGDGTTTPGFGNLPNRSDLLDRGKIADLIKNGGLKPIGGGNNPPADPGNDPGNPGSDPGNDPANPGDVPPADPGAPADPHDPPHCHDDPHHYPPHHCPPHDCHPHFPWWPVVIDGGYCGTTYCPPVNYVTVVEQPIALSVDAPAQTAPVAGVDLELFDVRMVDAGDADRKLGPRYRIVFRNRGNTPAGNFQVMLMASQDGTPSTEAPTGAAEVETLAPGETRSADIRLPMSAELAAMPSLIVAIDSAVQVAETDEQNNVAVLDRAKIAMAEVTTVASANGR